MANSCPTSAAARRVMVLSQLRPQGVTDAGVLGAMGAVAREDFLPAKFAAVAYADRPLRLDDGAPVMAPAELGQLLSQLAPRAGERALVIGVGGAYSAAVLRHIGLTVGTLAARKPGGWFDSIANTTAFFIGAIPPFVSGVALQLIFAVQLGWLPFAGVYPPGQQGFDLGLMVKHLILPVTVVAMQTISGYSRYMRASLLDVKSSDYVRTARAKGLSESTILFKHGVRNALIPVVTLLGIDIGGLLGGLIITENIFNYPGMGKYFIDAQTKGDFPLLMPYLVIIVISVLLFNLIADISYAYLDPRIRLE